MRNRKRLQHHPAGLRRRFELEEQSRLADARLRHRGNDLPVPRLGLIGGMLERLHLALAPDELGQPAAGRTLQPRAQRSEPGHLINVDRLADAFDSGRTQRFELEVAFDEFARLFSDRDRTGRRQRLHPRGEIGGVPDRRVLDLTRAGRNRTHHHLASVHARRAPSIGRLPASRKLAE